MPEATGMTEEVWNTLDEDQRFLWSFFSKIITVVSSMIWPYKTGYAGFDFIFAMFNIVYAMGLFDFQRKASRFSATFRSRFAQLFYWIFLTGVSLMILLYLFVMPISICALEIRKSIPALCHDEFCKQRPLLFEVTGTIFAIVVYLYVARNLVWPIAHKLLSDNREFLRRAFLFEGTPALAAKNKVGLFVIEGCLLIFASASFHGIREMMSRIFQQIAMLISTFN